jgi:hypothetical protein
MAVVTRAVMGAVLATGMVLTGALASGPAGAAPARPLVEAFDAVGCPTASRCYADGWDQSGDLVVAKVGEAGKVGVARAVTGAAMPGDNSLACPSTALCLAVGISTSRAVGVVIPIDAENGVPGTPVVVPGTKTLTGISCGSKTECYAVGTAGKAPNTLAAVVPIVSGEVGKVFYPSVAPGYPTTGLTIGCETATVCLIFGTFGAEHFLARLSGDTETHEYDYSGVNFHGIDCPSPTECVAVGSAPVGGSPHAFVGMLNPKTAVPITSTEQQVGAGSLTSVACWSTAACVAVGEVVSGGQTSAIWLPISNGTAGTVTELDPPPFNGTGCLRNGTCFAAGGPGAVLMKLT